MNVPEPVSVPEKRPDEALNVRPALCKAANPALTLNVMGAVPPVEVKPAAAVAGADSCTSLVVHVGQAIVGWFATAIEQVTVTGVATPSLTVMVKANVPLAENVPVTSPVEAPIENPEGNVPENA